jgi:hypothetical protein
MTFEEHRRKLKLAEPKWGDLPKQLPHHVDSTTRLADFDPECQCASTLDAMARNDLKRAVESTSPPSNLAISTAGWTLPAILESSKKFRPIPRISCNKIDLQTEIDDYEKNGVPCIIEGWHNHEKWPKDLFNVDSFSKDVTGKGWYFLALYLNNIPLYSYHCSQRL